MRTVNFALILITGIVCVAVYRVAEDARVAQASLVVAERQIARERQTLVVLGAEWASLTRPQRIHALAERHLELTDAPVLELASFAELPHRGDAPLTDAPLRDANVVVPEPSAAPSSPAPITAVHHVIYRSGA
jgi:hypothetical protein